MVVVPLRKGAHDEARRLVEHGPPFDLEGTRFESHAVYLTREEAVFVFDAPGAPATLELAAENPRLWRAAAEWQKLMDGRPRTADTVYTWRRGA